jgi:hypothetical protein
LIDFWCLNANFNNISVISWRPVLVVEEAAVPPGFVNCKKGALDSQPHVLKFTSCLPMVGGFFRVLQLPPPPKLDYSKYNKI